MDRLVHGDNLAVLAGLPDGCVDLIYIDPPFGTGSVRSGATGAYQDPGGLPAYLSWLHPRLAEMHRVLAPHGSLFVHLDWRTVHHVRIALDGLFGAERFVNEIVWCYSVGGKSPRRFGRKHDNILWYSRGPDYTFFPDAVRVARKPRSHMKVEKVDGREVQVKRDRRTGKLYRYPVDEGKLPDDYWTDIETLNRSDRERTGWPTQKPEALLQRIILAASAPGALVADFFCGSGTTAVAASQLARRFLVVDASERAVAVTRERLLGAGITCCPAAVPAASPTEP